MEIITYYMVVHAWKVLCDDNEKLSCIYWKLGLTFCLLPPIAFITIGFFNAWRKGKLNIKTGLGIIAFGAFYPITFPCCPLCPIVCSFYVDIIKALGADEPEDWEDTLKVMETARIKVGFGGAVFGSLPQVSI